MEKEEGNIGKKKRRKKMLGTMDRSTPIRPMGSPISKTKKPASSRHHGLTVVTPTVRGKLLRAAVKGFGRG